MSTKQARQLIFFPCSFFCWIRDPGWISPDPGVPDPKHWIQEAENHGAERPDINEYLLVLFFHSEPLKV
jgi:hypothetical protein